MNIVSLFAGIGGFEQGLTQEGHASLLSCEILPAAQAVLRARFPGVELEPDIRLLDDLPAAAELVCAGFPCQDLSQAGRTRGIDGEQSGLVREVFRLLRSRRVPWVVIENVPFMLQLHAGAAVRAVVDGLEELGYRWAYRVVDTYSFGLPQRRERVYFVAALDADPADVLLVDEAAVERATTAIGERSHGFYWTEGRAGIGWAVDSVPTLKNGSTIGIPSPPAVLLPDGQIVKPSITDAERLQGFPAGWTTPAVDAGHREGFRWGLVGSAVSVPVTRWLGRRLNRPGQYAVDRDQPFLANGPLPRAARFDGHARHAVGIGADVQGRQPTALHHFLQPPFTPLSLKAAAGFHSRASAATTKLKFPPGFLDAVRAHMSRMQEATTSLSLPFG